MPGTSFSEHVLVILSTLDQCSHDLSILKIPENLLLHDSLSFQVVELWSQKNVLRNSMAMKVSNGLHEISDFFRM